MDLIDTHDMSVPTGLQLLVKSPSNLTSSLNLLEFMAFNDITRSHYQNIVAVDLNFGCPSIGNVLDLHYLFISRLFIHVQMS